MPSGNGDISHSVSVMWWGAGMPAPSVPARPEHVEPPVLEAASGDARMQTVFDVAAATLAPDCFREAAMAFVAALATRLQCDRVALGIVDGRRITVRALNHSSTVDAKSDLLRAIAEAMEEALDQTETVAWPHTPDARPKVVHAHAELAKRYGASAVCSIPVHVNGQIVAVVTLERGGGTSFEGHVVDLAETATAFVGPILDLKRREDRWLGVKAWDAGRRVAASLLGRGHLTLKVSALITIAVLAFLALATGDFRVTGKALIEGEVKHAAVAPFAGFLDQAPVRAGDVVQTGQLLASLQEHDARLERVKWTGQVAEYSKEYRRALSERDAPKAEIAAAQMGQAEAQLRLAEEKLRRVEIKAPFAGVVVSGDLSQKLGSPLEEGQVLFEIAPLNTYRVTLDIDERDIGHVAVGQEGHVRLSSLPEETYRFTVIRITPVSTARDGRNFFRVEARLLDSAAKLRPAMEGSGKITIDRRRLSWIWTHDAVDWLSLKLWRWLP